MKKITTLIFFLPIVSFHFTVSFAQTPDWLWAKSAGKFGDEEGKSIVTDTQGNVYITGRFTSGLIMMGNYYLNNLGESDIFLAKYGPDGNVMWAKRAGGSFFDSSSGIAIDSDGNVYITGSFSSPSITFGSFTLNNNDQGSDIFLVKYDPSGNVLWAKRAGGMVNTVNRARGVATDNFDNIYIAGEFWDTTITFGTISLNNAASPYSDIFIAKYDYNGNLLWAKREGGNYSDGISDIAADDNGNVFVTGGFTSSVTFGNFTLTQDDYFIVKYNASGNVQWAKSTNGGITNGPVYDNYHLAVDGYGNAYVTGTFRNGQISFGNFTLINPYYATDNMFIVKYDPSGKVIWAKNAYGNDGGDDVRGSDISVDNNGNAYVIGYFQSSSMAFENFILTNVNTISSYCCGRYCADVFIVKYDIFGKVLWAKSAGAKRDDFGSCIAADNNGYIYITGYFDDYPITFGDFTLSNIGDKDFFMAKLDSSNTVIEQDTSALNDFEFTISPNPFFDMATVSYVLNESENVGLEIFNQLGERVSLLRKKTDEKQPEGRYEYQFSTPAAGIYFVKLQSESRMVVRKITRLK